jgi:hypothetical protein
MPEISGTNSSASEANLADFVMNGGTWADTKESVKSAEVGASAEVSSEPELSLDGEMLIDLDGPSLREEVQRAEAAKSGSAGAEVSETATKAADASAKTDLSKVIETTGGPAANPSCNSRVADLMTNAADRIGHFLENGTGFFERELKSARKGVRMFADALDGSGVTPTPGDMMKLYLARNSAEFKSGKIVGSETEMGALDIGRLKAVNAYTQMGLKNSLIREFSSIRRSFGTIGEDDLKELCKKVEIVAELKDGKITRDGQFVKTKIKDDDLVSGIIEGIESAAFKKVVDDKEKHVGWTLANGKFLTEDGRQSIAAKIVSAHFEGGSALEYKGDQIIDAVSIVEGWKPVQINRFKQSIETNLKGDGSIYTSKQSFAEYIFQIVATTINRGG